MAGAERVRGNWERGGIGEEHRFNRLLCGLGVIWMDGMIPSTGTCACFPFRSSCLGFCIFLSDVTLLIVP